MEGKKQEGSASSFSSNLFGSKESSSSSTGIFRSVFPPASAVVGRSSSRSDVLGSLTQQDFGNQAWNKKPEVPDNVSQRSEGRNHSPPNKTRGSNYQEEGVQPCFLSSSLYYGGQDIYSNSPNTHDHGSHPIIKKDGREDNPNESNLNSASRGNWWEGSLYY